MKIIAHRGNLYGPNPGRENHPDYIAKALYQGFDVEIDLWMIDNKFILGHDAPQYEINLNYLFGSNFWIHCKNLPALAHLSRFRISKLNYFFHNTDDATLTNLGWIWVYPGKSILNNNSIAVMPERVPGWDISLAGGICSDYPYNYKP